MIDRSVKLFNVPLFSDRMETALTLAMEVIDGPVRKTPWIIFTPTTEQVELAQSNARFCSTLNQSDLNLPDAVGLLVAEKWMARWGGRAPKIKERIPGIDLAEKIVLETLRRGKKVFLLGGRDSAAKAAEKFKMLNAEFKNLISWDEGAKNIENEKNEERRMIFKKIVEFRPELLLVAYGAPWQEIWIDENRDALGEAGVKVAMVVGGSFDVWAGKIPRAPLWWRKMGMEWLWRLGLQPWRLKRQLALVKFGFRVGREFILRPRK